jgi:hypothetical protein
LCWRVRSWGLSKSTIGRIWRDFGLKPHRADMFKLSTDPLFVEKVIDVVGWYHNPPERAVALGVDEKSQIQALDRSSQPVLSMMPGMPGMPERLQPTTTSVTASPLCSRRSTSPMAPSSASCTVITGRWSSRSSRSPSTRPCSKVWTSTWSATTTAPTKPRRSKPGWPDTPASTCISPRPVPPGSTSVERWFGFRTDQMIRRGVQERAEPRTRHP